MRKTTENYDDIFASIRACLKTEMVKSRGVLPIMGYTGRLRPKGVPFSGWRYIKG